MKSNIKLNTNNIEILYDKILVFRNGIVNPEEIVDLIEQNGTWTAWYDVGEQIVFNPELTVLFDTFPTESEWVDSRNQLAHKIAPVELKDITEYLEDIFYQATAYYFDKYPSKQDNWMHGGSNILKYHGREAKPDEIQNLNKSSNEKLDTTKGQAGGTKELTLPFHTDFYQGDEFEPGPKAEYTITIYLNDDYEGGEIDYRIYSGKDGTFSIKDGEMIPNDLDNPNNSVTKIAYRPKKGDVIIFPSRVPYYHGVRRVTSGIKRFVRMFWMSQLN